LRSVRGLACADARKSRRRGTPARVTALKANWLASDGHVGGGPRGAQHAFGKTRAAPAAPEAKKLTPRFRRGPWAAERRDRQTTAQLRGRVIVQRTPGVFFRFHGRVDNAREDVPARDGGELSPRPQLVLRVSAISA
jgi:hypothetical protein